MTPPVPKITKKLLADWAGDRVVRDAETLVSNGSILKSEYEYPWIKGSLLWNNRELATSLELLSDGSVENHCPCYDNKERGIICSHVIALGLVIMKRSTDPLRSAKYREELRRASRLEQFDETDYIQRAPAGTAGAVDARIRLTLDDGWQEAMRNGTVPLICEAEADDERAPLDAVPRDLPLCLSKSDESLLFVLEDISEGPAKGRLEMRTDDFANILEICKGHVLFDTHGNEITINEAPMTTVIRMDLDHENGELILIAHTELPFMKPGQFPFYLISGKRGWAFGANNFWPLSNVLPGPYHPIYQAPVILDRPHVVSFLQTERPQLEKHARIESDLSLDLFTIEPATPRFRLIVRGSPASLSAILYAEYDGMRFVATRPDAQGHFTIPDAEDLLRYETRNIRAEQAALDSLRGTGFSGACGNDLGSLVGKRDVLNFLGSSLPALRRRGWRVELEGRISHFDASGFIAPVVHVRDVSGTDWFDVGFDFESPIGASISSADVQRAIRRGESYVEHNGKTLLLDTDAVESMMDVFADCASGDSPEAGHFRLKNIYSAFVKSSLDSLDGVDVEDTPEWRVKASQSNRTMKVEPVQLTPHMEKTLRGYQKEGVNWLRFLERSGFCGLLADEMGLGKTLQTLAWLELERTEDGAKGRPALIVCPTSLVENWAEESARFAPGLRVLTLSGPDRHEKWSETDKADVLITSYALLRRDLEQYQEMDLSIAILDEAQHIKNRSTQNAKAAKQIQATHRLVLTGTPVENSVSDLWSIMDFLMPGYLHSHDVFKANYEQPISQGNGEAIAAQARLRRKLQPFLLRRKKVDVAKDLPPKIQKISACSLSPDQMKVYNEMLQASRRRLTDLVATNGFNRCRMEILTTLMRLRQICCHLGLLDLQGLDPEFPSAKMDIFFELVNEAIDGGHRILVFSQFVSMLHILRKELEERDIDFCYLDGSTKERLKVVHQFNTQRDIPIFLISLKAGGTGLNLTGADVVIHFDPWWNPAVEDQATDRAYRIGQKRTVYSVKLITRNTVEEKVLELQERKKAIIDATVESDERMVQSLTWDDVQDLLSV